MTVRVIHRGDFRNTEKILTRIDSRSYIINLSNFGERGVTALSQATPKLTGETASSWSYSIVEGPGSVRIVWSNDELISGAVPLAILLQYGHGTRQGGYVEGIDFINPAMQGIFDQIAKEAWDYITR